MTTIFKHETLRSLLHFTDVSEETSVSIVVKWVQQGTTKCQ